MSGFNLVKKQEQQQVTIDSLTPEMINDLIKCYAYGIASIDVQMNNRIFERIGTKMEYPRITKEVVEEFYTQVDGLVKAVKDIIRADYHTTDYTLYPSEAGLVRLDGTPASQEEIDLWEISVGSTPATVDELKQWTFFIVKRDYYEVGSWIYSSSEGDFQAIKPFIENAIDLMIQNTDGGDYNTIVDLVKNEPLI